MEWNAGQLPAEQDELNHLPRWREPPRNFRNQVCAPIRLAKFERYQRKVLGT